MRIVRITEKNKVMEAKGTVTKFFVEHIQRWLDEEMKRDEKLERAEAPRQSDTVCEG